MSGKGGPARETFAEIVAAVEAKPSVLPEEPIVTPGHYSSVNLCDLAGHPLHQVDDRTLDTEEIRTAVLDGARLVWDACGCGGYCNELEWPEVVQLRNEAAKAAPRFRENDRAHVTRLTGAGGDVLLVVGGLRWGDLFR
jgi:hypothetical protein